MQEVDVVGDASERCIAGEQSARDTTEFVDEASPKGIAPTMKGKRWIISPRDHKQCKQRCKASTMLPSWRSRPSLI